MRRTDVAKASLCVVCEETWKHGATAREPRTQSAIFSRLSRMGSAFKHIVLEVYIGYLFTFFQTYCSIAIYRIVVLISVLKGRRMKIALETKFEIHVLYILSEEPPGKQTETICLNCRCFALAGACEHTVASRLSAGTLVTDCPWLPDALVAKWRRFVKHQKQGACPAMDGPVNPRRRVRARAASSGGGGQLEDVAQPAPVPQQAPEAPVRKASSQQQQELKIQREIRRSIQSYEFFEAKLQKKFS